MWPGIRRIYQGVLSISLRWLGVAVLFFAAGWWLTTHTVYTRARTTDSQPTVWFDISAGKDKVHNPTIVYLERTGSDSLALSFMVRGEEVDTSVKLELIGVDENRCCVKVRERKGVVNYEPVGERLRVE